MHLQTVAEQLINPIQALVRLCTLQAGMKTNQRQPVNQTIWQLINNHCHTMTLPQHFIGPAASSVTELLSSMHIGIAIIIN